MSVSIVALSMLAQLQPAVRAAQRRPPAPQEHLDPNGYFVDPVRGRDEGDGRSPERPWRTLTYALPRAFGGPAIVELAPGEYSEASGERFPLVLTNGYIQLVGRLRRGARIVGPEDPAVPVFRTPVNTTLFSRMEVVAAGLAFDVTIAGDDVSFAELEIRARRGIDVHLTDTPYGSLSIAECEFRTAESAIALAGTLDSAPAYPYVLDLAASRFAAGPDAALVDVRCAGRGLLRIVGRTNAMHAAGAGYLLRTTAPLALSVAVESSVFHSLGSAAFAGGPLRVEGSGASAVSVRSSIFHGNHAFDDLPGYDPATHVLERNLFEDPDLVGIGGSIGGDPRFADAAAGDFHLLPDSPARGAGLSAAHAIDLDHDPRGFGADDDAVDIGADEFFARYHWFHPRPRLGQPTICRILGEPGDVARVFAGPLGDVPPWFVPPVGVGWQLDVLLSPRPLATAVIGPAGIAEVPLLFPRGLSDVRVRGRSALTQVQYLTGGGAIEFSANAVAVYLTD